MWRLTWRNPLNDVTRGRAEELKARLTRDQMGMVRGRVRQRWGRVKQTARRVIEVEKQRLDAQNDPKRKLR